MHLCIYVSQQRYFECLSQTHLQTLAMGLNYEKWLTYDHLTLHFTSTMASETEWGFLGILGPSHWDCHGPPLKLEEESPATVAAPPAKKSQRVLADLGVSDMSLNQKTWWYHHHVYVYIYIYNMCERLVAWSGIKCYCKSTRGVFVDFRFCGCRPFGVW